MAAARRSDGDNASPELLTTAQTAAALNVTERRARQLAEFLHATRAPDGSLRFRAELVDGLVQSRATARRAETNSARLDRLEADVERLRAEIESLRKALRRRA